MRTRLVSALVLVFGIAAIAAITLLHHNNAADRDAELKLANARTALTALQSAPYAAAPEVGGDPELIRTSIIDNKRVVDETIAALEQGSPPAELAQISEPLRANYRALDQIYRLATTVGLNRRVDELSGSAVGSLAEINGLLDAAGAEYHGRAVQSRSLAVVGSAAVIILLLSAFGFFYLRSDRLKHENLSLLAASRREALTDALTGLGNRRALLNDLETRIPAASGGQELLLALFDLDGFKQYNDSFGHPAGDTLLHRLGARLAASVGGVGSAYRLGGDEFCVLMNAGSEDTEHLRRAAAALSDSGHAFTIGCSYGTVLVPTETTIAEEALQISDQRMYGSKAARGSASRQSTDVLLKVLDEQSEGLVDHVNDVAELATLTGEELGLGEAELNRLRPAAELHDIGKCAIPKTILNKPVKLDPDEWEFIRRHTLIGERIVAAAPSLAGTAPLIRSCHEHFDGTGYPDGLAGSQIPFGARIISVCDAFAAMTATRPYSPAVSTADAAAELRRCAASQFDPDVVQAFCTIVERRAEPAVLVAA